MTHHDQVKVGWTGNRGSGTAAGRDYGRNHQVIVRGTPILEGAADAACRGDPRRHDPEDPLVAALATCHMLWYLHFAAEAGIVVTGYRDEAEGVLEGDRSGGHFTAVVLRPTVTIGGGDPAPAESLHAEANRRCFIASSVNFPVRHRPTIIRTP